MRKLIYIPVLLILTSVFLWRCSGKDSPELARIASMVSDSPKVALAALGELGDSALSEADRHYRDLLLIKARDKAYVTHTSDSLILDCLGYYDKHKGSRHYPEALYYGGRVYSDIGDYPTALRYFQSALDEFDRHEYDLKLKKRILSQTGRLLNTLRIHRQAVPYLRETLGLDSVLKDTFGLAYNHLLLGDIFDKLGDYDEAEIAFRKAYDWSMLISPIEAGNARIYLASVKLHKGNVDSALDIIRGIGGEVIPEFRNVYLAIGSEVYYRAGVFDTAYIYAHELVLSPDPNNRKSGYRILLSPELRKFINKDSLSVFYDRYWVTMNDYVSSHEGEQVVVQNSMYNYSLHERKRMKAEKDRDMMLWSVAILVIMVMALLLYIYIKKNIHNRRLIELQNKLYNASTLKAAIQTTTEEKDFAEKGEDTETAAREVKLIPAAMSEDELRKQLQEELRSILEKTESLPPVSHDILGSEAYRKIQGLIDKKSLIPDGKPLWNQIEGIILNESKDFKHNLMLLTNGKLDDIDYHIALLMRCGFNVANIATLVGRSKSTVSARRSQLGERMFGNDFDVKSLGGILRIL